MIKLIKRVKQLLRSEQDKILRKTAKTADHLYSDSPYNSQMVELHTIADIEHYNDYTVFRKAFETEIRKIAKRSPYIIWKGDLYGFKPFKGNLSLRESGVDKFGINTRMRFSVEIIKKYFLNAQSVYLAEHDTAYHKFLSSKGWFNITTSLYAPGNPLHQDMTKLTFADNGFDLIMSYEDLEHIPNYKDALQELYRVTKPGGHLLISVPFGFEKEKTLIRATVDDQGNVTHLMEPDYHGDPVLPQGVLCFYHFGWDLLEDFKQAGFKNVKVVGGYDIDKLLLDVLLFIVAEK